MFPIKTGTAPIIFITANNVKVTVSNSLTNISEKSINSFFKYNFLARQ